MNFADFQRLTSAARMARFLAASGGDGDKAMSLYRSNIRLSSTLFGVLSVFEIVLRNTIDRHYCLQFPATATGDHWLPQAISSGGFLTSSKCRKSFDKIDEAVRKLGTRATHDRIVAELSLGFWKYLFAQSQFVAGRSSLLSIFPSRPVRTNQRVIYDKLDRINAVRNRVAHHEPICFGVGNTISTHYVRSHYQDIIDLIDWIGIDAAELLADVDFVLTVCGEIDAL